MRNRLYQIIVCLSLSTSTLCAFSTGSSGQRDSLLRTLDSLELIIQDARRNGEDLQAIVDQAESLKIAIDFANESYSGEDPSLALGNDSLSKVKQAKSGKKLTLPSSLIDWLIVLVGAIAAVAALMLAVLHGIKVFRRNRLMKRAAQQRVPQKPKPIQPERIPADRTVKAPAPIEEPIVPLATYTRQGVMKTAAAQAPNLEPEVTPAVNVEPAPAEKSIHDIEFVQSMLSELMAKKASVEQKVAEVSVPVEEIVPVSDFADELQSHDNLFDGLEDIMAEIESEISGSIEEPSEPSVEESVSEPIQTEPSKPRALTARETILELHQAELSPSEIARKLSMSVGEVQLIISMARRS